MELTEIFVATTNRGMFFTASNNKTRVEQIVGGSGMYVRTDEVDFKGRDVWVDPKDDQFKIFVERVDNFYFKFDA